MQSTTFADLVLFDLLTAAPDLFPPTTSALSYKNLSTVGAFRLASPKNPKLMTRPKGFHIFIQHRRFNNFRYSNINVFGHPTE